LVKAREAKDSGFIPQTERLTENRARAPFHRYWVADPVAYESLRFSLGRVYVAPVDTSYAVKKYQDSDMPTSIAQQRAEEIEELGRYLRERVRMALSRREGVRVTAEDTADPNALVLRLALVDVVPTNPGVNVLGTAAGFFFPGGGLIKALGEGSVAFEGLVEKVEAPEQPLKMPPVAFSASPQEVSVQSSPLPMAPTLWEAFKDREGQKISAFSVKDYQKYAHIRVALDEWAMQIAQLFNTPHDVTVEEVDLLSVNPL
jgi:hypothetical protein